MADNDMVTVVMACPGYESKTVFPLHGHDAAECFCLWLETQLRYLRARKGGTIMEVREVQRIDGQERP